MSAGFENYRNLSTFYRFEGASSFHYYDFSKENYLSSFCNYVYFSKSRLHHNFYVRQKLRQLIDREILADTDFKLTKNTIVSSGKYKEIIKKIEMFQLDDEMSIEAKTSPLFKVLLKNNYTYRHLKNDNISFIERVDTKRPGDGGYGFSNEWLEVFDLLTYFYCYQRITKNDLLYYIEAFRYNVISNCERLNPVKFLESSDRRVIKINEKLYNSFSKYELTDVLERIKRKGVYLPNSYIDIYQDEAIKRIVSEYSLERERILEGVADCPKKKLIYKK